MRTRAIVATSLGLLAATAGAAGLVPTATNAHASPPAPSAAPSAAASAGPVEPAGPTATIATYAWPTSGSPEPKEDEWASATRLGSVAPRMKRASWEEGEPVTCTERALRDWVRVTCAPRASAASPRYFGVVWGLAGDLAKVKARFTMLHETDGARSLTPSPMNDLTLRMGVDATVTFQALPGAAFVVSVDQIGWDEQYDGGAEVFSRSGLLVDLSWAPGETAPSIVIR